MTARTAAELVRDLANQLRWRRGHIGHFGNERAEQEAIAEADAFVDHAAELVRELRGALQFVVAHNPHCRVSCVQGRCEAALDAHAAAPSVDDHALALSNALRGVSRVGDGQRCWCEPGRVRSVGVHQPQCLAARNALHEYLATRQPSEVGT